MSASESDSIGAPEEEDEGKIYQWIYELNPTDLVETFPYSSPLHLEINTEKSTHAAESPKEHDSNLSENGRQKKKKKRSEQCLEKKPWKKPYADISDYFNYGFNEETWSAYCKKQTKLKAFRKKHAKIMTQKEHAGYVEEVPSCSHSSSSGPSIAASRESNTGVDARGGKDGCSSSEEGRPCSADGSSNVVTEVSPEDDNTTAHHLPTSVSVKSLFAFVPPPPFIFRSEHSMSSPAALGSEHPDGFCGPSTSLYRCSSGSTVNMSAGIDTTKAWECYVRHQRRDKERNRPRQRGHGKDRKRCRNREKHSFSSSHHREEEQKKSKRYSKLERKHPSGEKRETGKCEGQQKTSQSSGSKKKECEDRDRGGRHKGQEKQGGQREQPHDLH